MRDFGKEFFGGFIACVAGIQRGGRGKLNAKGREGKVECEREARSLGARRERLQ